MFLSNLFRHSAFHLVLPIEGTLLDLSEVPDPTFSQKMLGDGFAVQPAAEAEGLFLSPADGVVETVFPTGHAFGIRMHNGLKLLVHIGLDTVGNFAGGFTPIKRAGDRVKAGEAVLRADLEKMRKAGMSDITSVIFLNEDAEFLFRFAEDSKTVEVTRK